MYNEDRPAATTNHMMTQPDNETSDQISIVLDIFLSAGKISIENFYHSSDDAFENSNEAHRSNK